MGNEAVDQLSKFDRALKDFSAASGKGRGIDGMLVTKWDTVDDKVCTVQFLQPSFRWNGFAHVCFVNPRLERHYR